MAKYDTGSFIGGFGESFLKAIQSERDRKQKEQEFQQKMGLENRQLKLIDLYRNNALAQNQSQFETKTGIDQAQFGATMDFKEKGLAQDQSQFDLGLGFKQTEADRNFKLDQQKLGLGWGNLKQREKEFDLSKTQPSRSEVDQRQVEDLFGKVQGYLDQFKGDTELKDNSLEYGKWKQGASGDLSQLLEKVGVPINGEVAGKLRSVISESDDSETKRQLLNEAINELYGKKDITEEQKRALQIWKELGTR